MVVFCQTTTHTLSALGPQWIQFLTTGKLWRALKAGMNLTLEVKGKPLTLSQLVGLWAN